ncbi:exosortase U [Rubritalea tangerina]|uniref:Exosortase U n=2 Tax=Rubritalea tangerina TaxID=430798 RepID=A0ABW4ZAP8_9BACT
METRKQSWGYWALLIWGGLLFLPLAVQYWQTTIAVDYYKWLPVAIIAAVLLFFRAMRASQPAVGDCAFWVKVSWFVICMAGLGFAYLYNTPWLGMIVFVPYLGLVFQAFNRDRSIPFLFGIWALFLLLCRLPGQLELRLLRMSSGFSAKIAGPVVDALGIFNVVQGEVMTMGNKELNIELVTDHYFTLYGVAMLAAFLCFFRKRNVWHTVILVASAFVVATVVNTCRLCLVAYLLHEHELRVMESVWQWGVLLVSYGGSLLLLMSVDALLDFMLQPIEEPSGRTGKQVVRFWNGLISFRLGAFLYKISQLGGVERTEKRWVLVCVSVVLISLTSFISTVKVYEYRGVGSAEEQMHKRENLSVIDPNAVEFTRPGWKVLKVEAEERPFDSIWGAFSFVWRLQYHDTIVVMALDYPFDDWHDVKVCYGNLGWTAVGEKVELLESNPRWYFSETDMVLPTGDYGFVMCSLSDHGGRYAEPKPVETGWHLVKYKFGRNKWVAPFGRVANKDEKTLYQNQVMVTTAFPLDEVTKQEIRAMYGEFREQTRALVMESTQVREGGGQ